MSLPGKQAQKRVAQDMLLNGIGNVLGYWQETDPNPFDETSYDRGQELEVLTRAEQDDFGQVLRHEADRIAKLFGYDKAWVN